MTRAQVEVITVGRRRRWSRVEKERLVAASLEPGASASEIARSAGLHVSQLFRWRKQLCDRVPAAIPALIPVEIVAAEPAPSPEVTRAPGRHRRRSGVIEIALGGGRRVRVDRDVDVEALRRVLDALGR
jgi:transposase